MKTKEATIQATNPEDNSFSNRGGNGNQERRPHRRPPPPLPLGKETRYHNNSNTTPRSMIAPGRIHVPPPPRSPMSAGPALETIPASPDTLGPETTTGFAWCGPASAKLPPTSTMIFPPASRMARGSGRGHNRVASTGSQPLRAPRPLSERPLIFLGDSPYSPSPKDRLPAPQIPWTVSSATASSSSKAAKPVTNLSKSGPLKYDELTTRRSRPRIPICSVTDTGGFQVGNVNDGGNSHIQNHYDNPVSWIERRIEHSTPEMAAMSDSPSFSVVNSASLESECSLCVVSVEACGGDCQAVPTQLDAEKQIEYSDSEYDQSPVERRTLSPNMKFLPRPITPTRPLRCVGDGEARGLGISEALLPQKRSPKQDMEDFSLESVLTLPEWQTKTANNTRTIGWSRVSSPAKQLNAVPTNCSFSNSAPSTPALSASCPGGSSSRTFSPLSFSSADFNSDGMRKGSASSAATTSTTSSILSNLSGEQQRPTSSALFHLERSIKNDPSWSPLVPGSPALAGGNVEVLRLGRVPSGIVGASSVSYSTRESSGSSLGNEEGSEPRASGESERGVGLLHKRSDAETMLGQLFSHLEQDSRPGSLASVTVVRNHGHGETKREARGCYGGAFSYDPDEAEEMRQAHTAAAPWYEYPLFFVVLLLFFISERTAAPNRFDLGEEGRAS